MIITYFHLFMFQSLVSFFLRVPAPPFAASAFISVLLSLLPAASKLFYRLLLTLFVPVIAGLTDFKYAGQIVGFQI